jgi:hypothetical protein
MLPAPVSSILASAAVVGFSGSRAPATASLAAVQLVAVAVGLAPTPPAIIVGDAVGIDQHVAGLLPQARVFRASAYRSANSARSVYAMRSIACVRAVAGFAHAVPSVWASFPAGPCPAGLHPSSSSAACFNGSGSGTWASLAYAIGSGIAPLVFLPPVAAGPAPAVPPASFGLVSVGQGWYVAAQSVGQLAFL